MQLQVSHLAEGPVRSRLSRWFNELCELNVIKILMEGGDYPRHCIVTCDGDCIEGLYNYGFIVSLVASVLTSMVALYHVVMHFINFNNPYFQSKIISTSRSTQSSC